MKKVFAILMILALVVSAIPVFAEDAAGADAATSATVVSGKGGRNNGRDSRQMPGGQQGWDGRQPGNGQNGQQVPAMPGQGRNGQQFPGMPGSAQNAPSVPDNSQGIPDGQQAPVMPDNSQAAPDSENTPDTQQAPETSVKGQKGRGTRNQVKAGKAGLNKKTAAWLDQLLADGVITQEIHDAIVSYLEAQQAQAAAAEPAEGTEPPALPDGAAPAEGTEPPAVPEGEAPDSPEALLLKQLLDSGVITQEQYDSLLPSFQAPAPAESNG